MDAWRSRAGRVSKGGARHELMVAERFYPHVTEGIWSIYLGSAKRSLVFVEVFAGDVVFGDFVGVDFAFVGITGVLDALHYFGFEGVPFLEQFVDTL